MLVSRLFLALLVSGLVVHDATARGKAIPEDVPGCGPFVTRSRMPPNDYRSDRAMLPAVEAAHFNFEIEHLIKPRLSTFGAAIDYTLHAYPNHPRALLTLVKLADREQNTRPKGMQFSVDCAFLRAIRFVPDDHVVRMLYAQYLGRLRRVEEAKQQLSLVNAMADDNPLTRRNLGLLYVELKDWERALEQAWRIEGMGQSSDVLKDALVAAGQWKDRIATPAASPDVPASTPAPSAR